MSSAHEKRWAREQVNGGRAGWLGGKTTLGYLDAIREELRDWMAQADRMSELLWEQACAGVVEDGDNDGRSG